MRRSAERSTMRIGYLMSHYPAISHAFILREVEQLRRVGVEVHTMSIHAADRGDLLAEADRCEYESTFAILPTGMPKLLGAHLSALLRGPGAYFATLLFAVGTSPPGLRNRVWRLFYFAEAIIAWRHCRRVGIRHIHAQFADAATDVAMLVAHFDQARRGSDENISWSLAVHGPVEFYNVARYALPHKLKKARFALAISDFCRSQLMWFAESDRWPHLHVVHCGVDPSVYVPSERLETDDVVTILTVGRLIHGKGLLILLEAMDGLRKKRLRVRLIVVGDGPVRSEFEQAARRLGLDDAVDFVGAVGQDEIRRYYGIADVFCLSSFAEGIPVVLMEAMAMEIPVVGTAITGIPELITNGIQGLLVPPGRVDALISSLEILIVSPSTRTEMGRAGRQKVLMEFDVRESALQLKQIFASELSRSPQENPRSGGVPYPAETSPNVSL
jgi:colanic acid/amylovoran biosynthesis glycosyltransferase